MLVGVVNDGLAAPSRKGEPGGASIEMLHLCGQRTSDVHLILPLRELPHLLHLFLCLYPAPVSEEIMLDACVGIVVPSRCREVCTAYEFPVFLLKEIQELTQWF